MCSCVQCGQFYRIYCIWVNHQFYDDYVLKVHPNLLADSFASHNGFGAVLHPVLIGQYGTSLVLGQVLVFIIRFDNCCFVGNERNLDRYIGTQ